MSCADRDDDARGDDFWVSVAAILVVVAIVCGAVWGYETLSCHVRWSGFGSGTRWRPIAGCQVQVGDRWVPEKNVRSAP